MRDQIVQILRKYPKSAPDEVIPMVLALQDHFGYCPEAALEEISLRTGIPSARLHGMITFFDGLHERSDPSPRDKHYDCPLPPATADPMAGTAGPELLRDILTGRLDTARLFTVLRRLRHEIIEAPVISVPRTTCSCGA
ncbi:MAG TPA: NAD(P)H-dependent oxidoreductase subunit E, partial [Bacteroidales bacterium]|nr:NAD(P)H-dependent oxidoreductase subunit E [Bacteroidales bacterium]